MHPIEISFQVKATDGNPGTAGLITYSIASGNTGTAFSIDTNLGKIYVAGTLNSLISPNYTLVVSATDKAPTPHVTNVTVTISVSFVDNTPPKFNTSSRTLLASTAKTWSSRLNAWAAVLEAKSHSPRRSLLMSRLLLTNSNDLHALS